MEQEKLFEEGSFVQLFGKDLYLEKVFLEYDGIPLLSACVDQTGKHYFCHCAEMRSFETWAVYPITIRQLIQMVANKKTPREMLGKQGQKVWIYRAYWDGRTDSIECVSADQLAECDALPKGMLLCLHKEKFAAYEEKLQELLTKKLMENMAATVQKQYQMNIFETLRRRMGRTEQKTIALVYDTEIIKKKDYNFRNELDRESAQFQLQYQCEEVYA